METNFGYKPLSWKLIKVFQNGAPDFAAAEELLQQGADINDQTDDKEDNVLSEILRGYWYSGACNSPTFENCPHEAMDYYHCPRCKHNSNPNVGESMIDIIKFFLRHGFDVNGNDGSNGRQSLSALALSSFDEYMIPATKLLLDAYGGNIPSMDGYEDYPKDAISAECSGAYPIDEKCEEGNNFDTVYEIYEAVENGRPYKGIDWFKRAVGKQIKRVLMGENELHLKCREEQSQLVNGYFYGNLYFIYDNGFLIITPKTKCWVNTCQPIEQTNDVSDYFEAIIDDTLTEIEYKNEVVYRNKYRPSLTMKFGKGKKVIFTNNIGEVKIETM